MATMFRKFLLPSVLLLSLLMGAAAQAQQPAPNAGTQRLTVDQLETLEENLVAAEGRLALLLGAVDTSSAEAWLEESALARLSERAQAEGISEAERALWLQAVEHEQAASERLRGALNRAEQAGTGPQQLEQALALVAEMTASLAASAAEWEDLSLSQLEQQITALSGRHTQAVIELDQRRETLARLEQQLRTQPETLEQLRRDREQQLAAAAAQQVEAALAEAQRAVTQALERRTNARIIATQLDSQTLPPRIERLQLEIPVLTMEQRWLDQRLLNLQAAFNQRSTEALRQLDQELQTLLAEQPEVNERFPDKLALLYQQIDDIDRAQSRIRSLQADLSRYADTEDDLAQTLANVRERLEVGGLNETLGSLFLEEQRRLRQLGDLEVNLRGIERELSQSRLRDITLREQLRALTSAGLGAPESTAQAELQRMQEQTINALLQAQESLTNQLRQMETQLRAVVDLADELEQVLRETLIWWPSHPQVGLEWLRRLPLAVLALLEPESWLGLQSALLQVSVGSPINSLLIVLLVALLFRAGQDNPRHLANLAEKTRHRFTDNIKLTFKAMARSVVRALPVPVLMMALSYRLAQVQDTAPGVDILSTVLFSAAIWWLAGHLFLLFTHRNGVGSAHFKWEPTLVRRMRRNLAWYLPVQFLLILFMALTFMHPSDLVFDVLGRLGLIASTLLTGLFAWRMLAPYKNEDATLLVKRRRRLFRIGSAAFAFTLLLLCLAGYLLTVNELLARTINTAVVAGLVWLGYRLAIRGIYLSEVRLRIRHLREERANAAAMESNRLVGAEGSVEIPESQLSLEDINSQTRTLVNVIAGGALVLALFWVWADILPALTWLDNFTLWSRTITVGEVELISDVTLQDFLLASFVAVLLIMATRNLPGLVEILLTRGTQMDASGRFTVATLLRYTIIIAMVVSVFSLVGLRWSELQWLVAALTLGLGFGLQEVVANFVSGIIMLFERPVRVGDTITIGEYSGTVGRIRTRATTIIDWDNREIVVPNKTFITERLINWTLSDTMTRIVLPIGVSYDSDVDLVMDTVQEIAEAHPTVLPEPAPEVLFLKFGDSSLSFELRIYVNQLSERLDTISDLHRSIIREFRAKGIEIAFPQMDLHIRDLPLEKSLLKDAIAPLAAKSN